MGSLIFNNKSFGCYNIFITHFVKDKKEYTGEDRSVVVLPFENYTNNPDALDSLSVNLNDVLGRNFYYAGKYDSAYEQLKKALTFDSGFNLAKGNFIYVLLERKNYPEAFERIKQLPKPAISLVNYYQGATLTYAYAISGNKTMAKTELLKSLSEYPDQSPCNIARIYVALDDYY